MERLKKYVYLALTVLTTGCTTDSGVGPVPVPDGVRALGVRTCVESRAAVDGTLLPVGSALGVVVTPVDGSGFFDPSFPGSASDDYYSDGRNVRFVNGPGGDDWRSVDAGGRSKWLFFSAGERALAYGYYPWVSDDRLRGVGSSVTVPVTILPEGTISVGGDAGRVYTSEDETDYMYSTRSDEVGAATAVARLVLKHALSRISFRVYTASSAEEAVAGDADSYYAFTGYRLRSKAGEPELLAGFDDDTRMSVSTGRIGGAVAGGEIVRRIDGYRMVRASEDTGTANEAAVSASVRAGSLLFPQRISHDGSESTRMEVVLSICRMRGDGTAYGAPMDYVLPLAVVPGGNDEWQAGKSYTYTVRFTPLSLSVEEVSVLEWEEGVEGDMHIGEDPYVSSAEVSPSGDIPAEGGACGVTLKGLMPSGGVGVRARSGGAALVSGTVTASGSAVSLAVPANTTAVRTVVFEYLWNGTWTKIAECSQAMFVPAVGDLYGGGVVYWVGGSDFRVVALDEVSDTQWSASTSYVLGPKAQSQTARNGASVMALARTYSDNNTGGASGVFSTDFPAFGYCYEKTDGGVPKGTWYLPSKQELLDLYGAKGSVESVITANGGTAFSVIDYWSATEDSYNSGYAWLVFFGDGLTSSLTKTYSYYVRCVRGKDEVQPYVSSAEVITEGDIPFEGATYSVTLKGILLSGGVEVRVQSGGTALITGTVTASDTPVGLAVPANTTGAVRTIVFEYKWMDTWTKIAERSQAADGGTVFSDLIYWSATEAAHRNGSAWGGHFSSGLFNATYVKTMSYHVRCIRRT